MRIAFVTFVRFGPRGNLHSSHNYVRLIKYIMLFRGIAIMDKHIFQNNIRLITDSRLIKKKKKNGERKKKRPETRNF